MNVCVCVRLSVILRANLALSDKICICVYITSKSFYIFGFNRRNKSFLIDSLIYH